MKTDASLKRLTELCPEDLLALLNAPQSEVLLVETLQLPATSTSLDNVLYLRGADGRVFLHLIEWQGYNDATFLWRVLQYIAWLGQRRTERPILVTIIYLKPGDDAGDTLAQAPELPGGWTIQLNCVRLWEIDAAAAIASGRQGWLALLPLLKGATSELVEQAVQNLLTSEPSPARSDLLTMLGIFAEPLFSTERFIRLVTKERLMDSDLISYLIKDKVQEFESQLAEFAEREAALKAALRQTVEDAIIARFPTVPAVLVRDLRAISDPLQLEQLHRDVLVAPDLAAVEALIAAAKPKQSAG